MDAYVVDWLNLGLRWLHVIAGIAWIGASFHIVSLDNRLVPPRDPADRARGVHGEAWGLHGGGFYRSQKYLTGPRGEPLTEDLHWFKWEAYTTWFSGMGLLAVVYWWGASAYLIDRAVWALSVPAAVAVSAGSLVAGWLVYDALCRVVKSERVLAVLVYLLALAAAWGYGRVFGPRAAYVHVGAMIGTIMVWNVFFHIIPGQWTMVTAIRAGQTPDPRPGIVGKQRSVHNTYFTLPVVFIMISGHYPMTFGHRHAWAVLAVIGLAGVLIRRFFVLRQSGRHAPALPAVAALLLVGLAVTLAPAPAPSGPPAAARDDGASFARVQGIVRERCASCHAERPTQPGFVQAPAGVMLDTPERIRAAAARIHQSVVVTKTMPLANLTGITDSERAALAAWIRNGVRVD
jgi:uncharacterized membrane protein